MAKNNKTSEGNDLRILTELVKELSRLDVQENKILRAKKKKTEAIQDVLDRLHESGIIKEKKGASEEISALLQNMQELISTLKALLRQ